MDVRSVSIDDTREFAVFAEHLSFTRAAEELHVSQPSLHVKVRKLGERLGCALYTKVGRHLVLTAEGAAVARFGRQADADVRTLLHDLRVDAAAPVVIAAGEGAHLYVLGPGLRRLLAEGRHLRLLNLDATAAMRAVRDGEADLAVVVTDRVLKPLRREVLASYVQVIAVPPDHPIARQRSVRIRELGGQRLVVPPPGRPHRIALDAALQSVGVAPIVAMEADGWQAMLRFVELGVGLAIVNGCVTPPGDVVTRPVEDLPLVTYSAVFRSDARGKPAIASVWDALRMGAP
ncbi:MAG: LysR family transcriptional regulator, low CO2-responsive transcriptional regulator [Actinomycetota bacterium]|jgi:DNA-binding transcriptional LysR family regulator|nr:LysR family transcriptional regulator, low CO2-responsive transcriptional regulator [Actinomycetota bacterium]